MAVTTEEVAVEVVGPLAMINPHKTAILRGTVAPKGTVPHGFITADEGTWSRVRVGEERKSQWKRDLRTLHG